MRDLSFLIIPVILLLAGCSPGNLKNENTDGGGKDSSVVSGTIRLENPQILYPIVVKWTEEFTKAFPKVRISAEKMSSEPAITMLMKGKADLAIISRALTKEEISAGMWSAPLAMDALVPVISFDNAFIQPLVMNGLSKDQLKAAFTGKIKNWGQMVKRKANDPLEVLVQPDSSDITAGWAAFLDVKPGEIKGAVLASGEQVMSTLDEEENGIGYCSILSLFDKQTKQRREGIYIVPVDFNNNGVIEDNEQFYDNFSLLSNAVATGKLPLPPARVFYIVAKAKPAETHMKEFIRWLLTTGQNYMPEAGFINIQQEKANAAVETLQ